MTFSRKHYEEFARVFAGVRPDGDSMTATGQALQNQWLNDVAAVASMFAKDNPRFDLARFEQACMK